MKTYYADIDDYHFLKDVPFEKECSNLDEFAAFVANRIQDEFLNTMEEYPTWETAINKVYTLNEDGDAIALNEKEICYLDNKVNSILEELYDKNMGE